MASERPEWSKRLELEVESFLLRLRWVLDLMTEVHLTLLCTALVVAIVGKLKAAGDHGSATPRLSH